MYYLGMIFGIVIGMGVRVLYNMLFDKEIPLFKYPYVVYSNGNYTIINREEE